MDILFFFGNVLADVGNFVVVGLVAGQRSYIEFVLQDPLYSCVIPQIFFAVSIDAEAMLESSVADGY